MKNLPFCLFFITMLILSCKTENQEIAIFLENESSPWMTDSDIISYDKSSFTFSITQSAAKKINPNLKKKFLLKVDGKTIYEGMVWSSYLSSLPDGIFIYAVQSEEMSVNFLDMQNGKLDKRNDTRLLNALKATNRLK